ncbi:unnamed protein product [Arctogadus glacialis]
MYERYKRQYSLRARGERPLEVVLIKIHRDVETTRQPVHSSSRPRTLSQPAAGSSPSPSSRSGGACSDSVSDTDSSPGVETGNDNVFIKETKQSEEALCLDDALWWAEIATTQIALNRSQRHAMLNGNRPSSDISDSRQK